MAGYGNFDYSDWQTMPDPNAGYVNPHQSGVARLGRALDPTSYIISAIGGKDAPQVHDIGERVADVSNEVLSPVMEFMMQGEETLNPYIKDINKAVGGNGLRNFVKNKPVDTAAILAASFFSGGAASAYAGGGGTAAAGTLGAAGQGAANAAITGASTSAASGLGAAGSAAAEAAITPAFASGAATLSAAPGALGATGTAALNAAIPSTFSALSQSIPTAGQSLLNMYNTNIKPLKAKVNKAQDLYSNFKNFSGQDQNEANRKRIEDQIMQNITGVNNGY